MNEYRRDELQAALRLDLVSFIQRSVQTVAPGHPYEHSYHVEAMAWVLEECRLGTINRLIITLPPRNLKSICASVAYPAWILGHDPTARIICVSYANELTSKHARDCRAVVESPWYRNSFPQTRINIRKNTETEFETTGRGYRYGTSLGGALTGRGGNYVIIDDPIKPLDVMSEVKRLGANQWFDGTLLSRLDNKKEDVIIIVMQRLHLDDLVGHVLEKGGNWVHLNLPAIADEPQKIQIGPAKFHYRAEGDVLHPEREPKEVLDQIKTDMGSAAFSAQYQQRPVPLEGNLVKWAWFKTYTHPPTYEAHGRIIQSWDTASKSGELNDYSVCTTCLEKGGEYFLLDVYRQRLDYPLLKKRVIEMKNRFAANTVLIEEAGSGIQLIQDLRYDKTGVWPIAVRPEFDKITRLSSQSAVIEAGRVFLPEEAPWLDEFKAEIMAFPNSKFDDQVDSLSQLLCWTEHNKRNRVRCSRTRGLV